MPDSDVIDTHDLRIDFGKHDGMRYTRVPASYLKWMVNSFDEDDERRCIAKSELKRRGASEPDIEVSAHAIDRISQKFLGDWQAMRDSGDPERGTPPEGISSWAHRVAFRAYDRGQQDQRGRYLYGNMAFVIAEGNGWPVVKTVVHRYGDG